MLGSGKCRVRCEKGWHCPGNMAGLVLDHLKLFTVYMMSFGSKGAVDYVFWEQVGRPLVRDHKKELERLCGYDVSFFSTDPSSWNGSLSMSLTL